MNRTLAAIAIFASLLLSASAAAQRPAPALDGALGAGYAAGSQYTATLEQTRNRWRMQPANGQDVLIATGRCASGAMVPAGVWLLVVDRRGRPELVAPSVTRLPAGTPDRVALRACDQARGRELAVPQAVLDLLVANTGAVYVAN